MVRILKYLLTFVLATGVFFLTTDCEVLFSGFNSHQVENPFPLNASNDVEHTHVSHHLVNDLIAESGSFFLNDVPTVSPVKPQYVPKVPETLFTSVWQPPKLSLI